jgi:hypothetical protein
MSFYKSRHSIAKEEIKLYYKDFKAKRDVYLKKAEELLGVQLLSFSVEEIDKFGNLYAQLFSKPERAGVTYSELLDIGILYYGEAWRCFFGGEWYFTLSAKDSSYGYPQIVNSGPEKFSSPISPCDYLYPIEQGKTTPLSTVIVRVKNDYIKDGFADFKPKNKN